MSRRVYLDDIRPCPLGWELVTTADECIAVLETGTVDLVSLDHDLADQHYYGMSETNEVISPAEKPREKTGYDVCLWLKSKVETDPSFRMPKVVLHTANPVGRANMAAVLMEIADLLTERALENE